MRPFEWLTSPSSLEPFLLKALHLDDDHGGVARNIGSEVPLRRTKKVLHVGCGTSALGEYLVEDPKFRVETVVNADCDDETLQPAKERWKERCLLAGVGEDIGDMCYEKIDFATDNVLPFPDGFFDLVVDKSTLDCTLCSDKAAAGLILESYRMLNPQSGVYLVVSFHHVDFLRPLLMVPGFAWKVNTFVMQRQVEELPQLGDARNGTLRSCVEEPMGTLSTCRASWSEKGNFEPDEGYRRTVNVLLCQRSSEGEIARADPPVPDRSAVARHVNETNDRWFQSQNPMLTPIREQDIAKSFAERPEPSVELIDGYNMLFTAEERYHYTFDLFLEDWSGYCVDRDIPDARMTFDVAIDFLTAMQ